MINTISYLILFLLGVIGIIVFPKTDGKLNIFKMVPISILTIFCCQIIIAGILNVANVKVGIENITIFMLVMDAVLWGRIIHKKRLQAIFFRVGDGICGVILVVFILGISYHLFGSDFRLSYANSDPANHFAFAMQIVNTGKLPLIYFSAFIDAMFIEVFSPFLAVSEYYKAFIVADIFMHVIEILMFYVLVLTLSDTKVNRILSPLFAIAYFWGYPAYSYMTGGFVYWSNGVVILMYIIYCTVLLEKRKNGRKWIAVLLVLGSIANLTCNKLFIVINTIAIVITMVFLLYNERKKYVLKKSRLLIAGFFVMGMISMIVLFLLRIGSIERIFSSLLSHGGIYQAMYAELIYFFPILILGVYYMFGKKCYGRSVGIMSICMIAFTVLFYILWYNYMMSTYYYYKIYYNLWLLGWLIAVIVVDCLVKDGHIVVIFSYLSMIGVMSWISLTNYDYRLARHDESYNGSYATSQIFSLYQFNMESILTDYAQYEITPQMLKVFSYSIENLSDKEVPIVCKNSSITYWYDGMRGKSSKGYYGTDEEWIDIAKKMDDNDVNRVLVLKNDAVYQEHQEYFEECVVIYENSEAAIYSQKGNAWTDVSDMGIEMYGEKQMLYKYIVDHLQDQEVPLLATQDSYMDFLDYYYNTSKLSTNYYTWEYDKEELKNNLIVNDINYVLLLKDDDYYKENEGYYRSQKVLYENEAGMIIRFNEI